MTPNMLLPKAMYFINTCAAVPWGRYKVIYFSSLGLTGTQVGAIRSATHGAKLVAWPLWGYLSDRVGSIRSMLIASLLLATFALELIRRHGLQPHAVSFSSVIGFAVFRSAMNAEWPLVDSATLALVQRHERDLKERQGCRGAPGSPKTNQQQSPQSSEGYGKQRLWAAIAWGATSLFVGTGIDYSGLQTVFILTYVAVALEVVLVMMWLPSDLKIMRKTETDSEPASSKGDEGPGSPGAASPLSPASMKSNKWTSPAMLMFMTNLLLYSVVHAVPEQVLFLHMERMGASRTLQGAATAASVIFEIPVFYHSDKLLLKYGTQAMCITAQCACALRLFLYYLVPFSSPWVMVPIQVLHGFSFGLLWTAAVPYVQSLAPVGKETFAQSVVCTVWGTVGQAIGSILWGAVYDIYSPDMVYFSSAVLTIGLLLCLTLPPWAWDSARTVNPGEVPPPTPPHLLASVNLTPLQTPLYLPQDQQLAASWKLSPRLSMLERLDGKVLSEKKLPL